LPLDLAETSQPMIDSIRRASLAKWTLIALALALLSIFFFRSRRWYLRVLAALDLAAGALACYGVFHNEWLPWAAGLLSAGLVLSAATLKLLTHESASRNLLPHSL
jgi:CHASE2 domain-containing sensor protein